MRPDASDVWTASITLTAREIITAGAAVENILTILQRQPAHKANLTRGTAVTIPVLKRVSALLSQARDDLQRQWDQSHGRAVPDIVHVAPQIALVGSVGEEFVRKIEALKDRWSRIPTANGPRWKMSELMEVLNLTAGTLTAWDKVLAALAGIGEEGT